MGWGAPQHGFRPCRTARTRHTPPVVRPPLSNQVEAPKQRPPTFLNAFAKPRARPRSKVKLPCASSFFPVRPAAISEARGDCARRETATTGKLFNVKARPKRVRLEPKISCAAVDPRTRPTRGRSIDGLGLFDESNPSSWAALRSRPTGGSIDHAPPHPQNRGRSRSLASSTRQTMVLLSSPRICLKLEIDWHQSRGGRPFHAFATGWGGSRSIAWGPIEAQSLRTLWSIYWWP